MCGGRGARLESPVEKPLLEIGGVPMIDRVVAALEASRIDTVRPVVSPHAPETRTHLEDSPVIETPGAGYVDDLDVALEAVETPVLTAAADLPLLGPDAVDAVLDAYREGSLTVGVPIALKRLLDLSVDDPLAADSDLVPAGVNVVADGGDDTVTVSYDVRLAVNVNRPGDAAVAEALA